MYTHDELVKHAKRFLQRKHVLVLTEMAGGCGEEADAIGWNSVGMATLIECKANRNDFLSDKRKCFRQTPHRGMAAFRYYLTNDGVIPLTELPENWGLMILRRGRFRTIVKAEFQNYDAHREKQKLISVIRRIGQDAPKGMAVDFYTYETKRLATLGVVA